MSSSLFSLEIANICRYTCRLLILITFLMLKFVKSWKGMLLFTAGAFLIKPAMSKVREYGYLRYSRLPQFQGMEATCVTLERIKKESEACMETRFEERRLNEEALQQLVGDYEKDKACLLISTALYSTELVSQIKSALGCDDQSMVSFAVNVTKAREFVADGSLDSIKPLVKTVEDLEKGKIIVRNKYGDLMELNLSDPTTRRKANRFVTIPENLTEESLKKLVTGLEENDVIIYTFIPPQEYLQEKHKHPEHIIAAPSLGQVEDVFHQLSYTYSHANSKYCIVRDPKLASSLGLGHLSKFDLIRHW